MIDLSSLSEGKRVNEIAASWLAINREIEKRAISR